MKNKKYTIEVVFTTPITVTVQADDVDDAMSEAEYEASKVFATLMTTGELYPEDFECEAQTP
jgi:hypothetical protein